MRFARLLPALLFLLSSTTSLLGAQNAAPLVVYSGRSESLMTPIFDQFTETTGIALEVVYSDTAGLAAQVIDEGESTPADVFVSQDAGALGALEQADLLQRLPTPMLRLVPQPFRSARGYWVGLSGRARVLLYNTTLVTPDELPGSILELVEPEWQGRVGWAPANASFQANVTAMRVVLGEAAAQEWLTAMLVNDVVAYDGNDEIVDAVAAGDIAAGLVNHYYLFDFLAENADLPLDIHYFEAGDVGALINVSGAGILSSTDQQNEARELVAYLLGIETQQYFADTTFEYPLISDVQFDSRLRLLMEIGAPDINLSELSDFEPTLTLLREVGALPEAEAE